MHDLVIASMPWLDVQLRGIGRHELRTELHHAKTLAAVRLTKPGGLTTILANHSLMDRAPVEARAAIAREATFSAPSGSPRASCASRRAPTTSLT